MEKFTDSQLEWMRTVLSEDVIQQGLEWSPRKAIEGEGCIALKKDGEVCGCKRGKDSDVCFRHAPKTKSRGVVCGALKKDGKPCEFKKRDGFGACGRHIPKPSVICDSDSDSPTLCV